MLEKPDLEDGQIMDRLWGSYGLLASTIEFLPVGDISSAKYCIATPGNARYFLKLRKGNFNSAAVNLPAYLHEHGVDQIIPPIQTQDGQLWTSLNAYTCILYPYIEGRNGFQNQLSEDQWIELGAAFNNIHSTVLPADLQSGIPVEAYSSYWRERAQGFLIMADERKFEDSIARKMAASLQEHRDEICFLIDRAEQLSAALKKQSPQWVLCHTDIHAGNMLLEANGRMHIMDWDDPIFSLKERDLMFIGGGIGGVWNTAREEKLFYQGYGDVDIHLDALIYFRYARIIEDIAEFCQQILLSNEGAADRERSFQKYSSVFLQNQMLDMAYRIDQEYLRV